MKLSKIEISELKSLYDLLIAHSDYISRNLKINHNNTEIYNKWWALHLKTQEKLKMVYIEINNRIENITE